MLYRMSVDSDPIRKIEAMLRSDEVLLWTGSPDRVFRFPRLRIQRMSIPSIVWLIAAIVLFFALPRSLMGGWAWWIALLVAPAGLILMSMYVIDPLRRANRHYAITNQRVIIVSQRGIRAPRSLAFDVIESFELTHDFSGTGSIDCFVSGDPDFDIEDGSRRVAGPLFEYVSDPYTVLALLRRQTIDAKSKSARDLPDERKSLTS